MDQKQKTTGAKNKYKKYFPRPTYVEMSAPEKKASKEKKKPEQGPGNKKGKMVTAQMLSSFSVAAIANPTMATSTMSDQSPEQLLPNVVVKLRCQLSDLTDKSGLAIDPYKYNAHIPSDIHTYNTSEYHAGSLLMEPIFNTQKGTMENNYAYLDAKWLHSGMMEHLSMNDVTPLMQQMTTNIGIAGTERGEADTVSSVAHLATLPVFNTQENSQQSMQQNMQQSEPGNGTTKLAISNEIKNKIFHQKVLLYNGMVQKGKKSACFWCTYDYDTPMCSIPQHNSEGTLECYGSFCRPECAMAYLYAQHLDDSVRAERDHLINYYYGKAYGYTKRIKPAPDPHYLLDKFYGTLTIKEYRKLLNSEYLLSTFERPMTRIFPELHDITDDFIVKIYGGDLALNRGYRVKRASEQIKGPSKTEILNDHFGGGYSCGASSANSKKI